MTHTPGPWHVGETRSAHLGWKEIEIKTPNGGLITTVDYDHNWTADEIATIQADARLIAEAPALLAMVKKALQFLTNENEPSPMEVIKYEAELKAAIVKAESSQHAA